MAVQEASVLVGAHQGEVIWVTGASSGIGRELALRLARAGALVIASGRQLAALQSLAAQHSAIEPLVFDVTDTKAMDGVRNQLATISPHLDRIVISAGQCEYFDINEPDWDLMPRLMAVNYAGAVNTLAIGLPLLQRRPLNAAAQRPHIVGVVSLVTIVPFARAQAYGASKAALQYLLDSLRLDLRRQRIDVTVINPGFVQSPLTANNDFPMPFLMSTDEAAERILRAIVRRPRQFDFPRRLHWILRCCRCIPGLWPAIVGPALAR